MRAFSPLALLAALLLLTGGGQGAAADNTSADQVAYGDIPTPYCGDILAVSATSGPVPGQFVAVSRLGREKNELYAFQRFDILLAYGMHPRASFGLSATHFAQDRGVGNSGTPIEKHGPGDTRIFVKWRGSVDSESPLSFGLRPSLRIPTGYDLEGNNLIPFTTRTVDFELLGLCAYDTRGVGLYLNGGVSLPGGTWHNELLGGIGVDVRRGLPFGFMLQGEYATRFDIPTEEFWHEIYGAIGHSLPFGLSFRAGLQRTLLHGETRSNQFSLQLGLGQSHGQAVAAVQAPPPGRPTHVVVSAVRMEVVDPLDAAGVLQTELVRELSRRKGVSANAAGEGVYAAGEDRYAVVGGDYAAGVTVVAMTEGGGRGFSIPKILAAPRATLDISAQVTVWDSGGWPIVEGEPINVEVSRGTGMQLFPPRGDEDTWVTTSEVRAALRQKGLERLAVKAADEVARVIAAQGR